MKRITIVLTLIFCFGSIWSNPIDTITAKRVAANFYRQNNVIGVKNGQTLRLQRQAPEYVVAPIDTVFTGFYVLNSINGDGFVIVSSDNNVMPILGYSNDRSMDINNMPLAFRDWLLGYEMEIRSARMDETLVSDEARREWGALLAGQDLPNRSTRSVPPLLTTTWSQEWPYNVACPNDASASGILNGHVYTGCVATAMAQVMKYWEHPQGGVGSHTYTHPIYGTLSSNFESLIAWNEMLDTYSPTGTYTVLQASAISSLMYMCGVSVEMNYDVQGSGAQVINGGYSFIPSAETALKTYFDYSANLRGILKSNYSNPQWINLLKNELDSGRVILYGGTDPEVGGHAFVCDGYSENYFHFNWGWNGSSDCYCLVTSLSPQNSSDNYSNQQHAVIGISPTNQAVHPNYDLVMNSTLTSSSQSYQFGSTVTITGSVANTGNAAFNGYIYAIVATINGDIVSRVPIYANISANQCVNQTFTIPGGLPLAPGQYFVCLTSSTNPNNVTAERLVRDDLSHRNFVEFSVEYESSIETFSNFTLSSEVIYPGQSITVNVDILNAGTSTFSGVVSVALVSSEGASVGSIVQHIQQHDLSSNSLQPNYHFTNGLDFTGTITASAGNYFLALLWKESSSADWRYAGSGRDYMNPVRIKVSEQPLADMYEVNNTSSTAFELSAIFSDDIIFVNTDGANFHTQSDVDYYKITLPSGFVYSAIPVLEDMYYNNDISYSVDAKLYYSVNNTSSWVGPIDLNENILSYQQYEVTLNNGGAVYYKVVPTYASDMGSYQLSVLLHRQILPDQYEENDNSSTAYLLGTISNNSTTYDVSANFHVTTDKDYYKINLPTGCSYTINANLLDSYNSNNYTADAKIATSTDGTTWSNNYGSQIPQLTIDNGGALYLRILPYTSNEIGTYCLHIVVTREGGVDPDQYEPNNVVSSAYQLASVSTNTLTLDVNANFHITTDNDFYKVFLPANYNYTVNAIIYTSYNTSEYTADAKFATSTNGSTWSNNYGTQMPELAINNGATLYFRVLPYTSDEIGTYQLHITIQRTPMVGIEEEKQCDFVVYPNPTSDFLHLSFPQKDAIKCIEILSINGGVVKYFDVYCEEIDMSSLTTGTYFIRIYTQDGMVTRKWCKTN